MVRHRLLEPTFVGSNPTAPAMFMKDTQLFDIKLFKDKKIKETITLSTSFGTSCKKYIFTDNSQYVVKELLKINNTYNSIYYEGKSLIFLYEKFPNLFPKVFYLKKNILVMEFIDNNCVMHADFENNFAYQISKIHKITNNLYGFKFDPPIGGLKQPSKFENSWVDFYGNKRLGMIFEIINKTNPMPKIINLGIESILKNLKNFIPNSPQPSLIHGDLWEGNILFNNGNIVALIDPGIYFAHHEMEIAYLEWFNFISNKFYNYYREYNTLDKEYFNYSKIYHLYYSLLNVHLWSREYIADVRKIVKNFI